MGKDNMVLDMGKSQKREDPFFKVLGYFMTSDKDSLKNLLAGKGSARQVGVLPTLLLHPAVDLAVVEELSRSGFSHEIGYLARTALSLSELPEPNAYYKKEFEQFKVGAAERLQVLKNLCRIASSSLDDFTEKEFKKHYEVYRYKVYNGTTTSPFS